MHAWYVRVQYIVYNTRIRKYGSESIIQALVMTLLQTMSQYRACMMDQRWIRDAINTRLVTIIKRLVHHAVYCITQNSLPFASCLQRKLNLRVTSRIRRTRPLLRHYNFRHPADQMEARALYRALPAIRRTHA